MRTVTTGRAVLTGAALTLAVAAVAVGGVGTAHAALDGDEWKTFLSRDRIGASAFTRAHEQWDGRGAVVLAVLDTGVDGTVPGLSTLPQGGVKVVAARDFTGQGDIGLEKPRRMARDGKPVLETGDGWVWTPTSLKRPPADGEYWLGFLDESDFRNSAVSDINGDGSTDGQFAVLVVSAAVQPGADGAAPAGREWIVYPDRDGDRVLDDEEPLRNYVDGQQTFTLAGSSPAATVTPLAFAPTVMFKGDAPTLSLHFVDGSHGTHVAGIAAGYNIHGQEGFDGIAPGARILSLKIGDNTLAGGSTTTESMKKALEYAARWSRERGDFVVVNMSYGIGSEVEGLHEIDLFVDELMLENPRMAVATSAGNSGPGLSTVGTPAGAALAVSVGALLTPSNARDLYGFKLKRDRLFVFSSRGGELDKPDVLAPGAAWSTVPDWTPYQIFRGTSMASPQVAGAMCLLASAAAAQREPLAITSGMIARALRHTARPVADIPTISQGGGVVDVPAAWDALRRFAARGEKDAPLGYSIGTSVPTQPSGEAPAAYWRAGGFVPEPPLGQTFSVKALLPTTMSAEERQDFLGRYDLKSTAGWIDVDRSSVSLRAEMASRVSVTYDADDLRKPGVYTGRVVATPRDASSKRVDTAFSLTTTVVVPHRFDRSTGYRLHAKDQRLPYGEMKRWFVMVPPGATSLDVRVRPRKGKFAYLMLYVFDPAGRKVPLDQLYTDTERGIEAHGTVAAERLVDAGIYEVVVYADYRRYGAASRPSSFDLDLRFSGLATDGLDFLTTPGRTPEGTVDVVNRFDERFVGRGVARLDGVQMVEDHAVEEDVVEIPFELGGPYERAVFLMEMDPADYGLFTDVALDVFDSGGNSVAKGGFSGKYATVAVRGAGKYTVRLRAARTHADGEAFELKVTTRYLYPRPIAVAVAARGAGQFALYPGVSTPLGLTAAEVPPQAPDGFAHTGTLELVDRSRETRWLRTRFSFGDE